MSSMQVLYWFITKTTVLHRSFAWNLVGYALLCDITYCTHNIQPLYKYSITLDFLGKMGNHRQALQLIVTQLQEVEYAIDFCKEHNYESLWNELIDYSLEKPSECCIHHTMQCMFGLGNSLNVSLFLTFSKTLTGAMLCTCVCCAPTYVCGPATPLWASSLLTRELALYPTVARAFALQMSSCGEPLSANRQYTIGSENSMETPS